MQTYEGCFRRQDRDASLAPFEMSRKRLEEKCGPNLQRNVKALRFVRHLRTAVEAAYEHGVHFYYRPTVYLNRLAMSTSLLISRSKKEAQPNTLFVAGPLTADVEVSPLFFQATSRSYSSCMRYSL